jgi:hypothetical protein
MSDQTNLPASPTYLGLEACRIAVFGDGKEAPSKRAFAEWKSRKYFPTIKVGRRVFADPREVERAISRRFKIEAIPAE